MEILSTPARAFVDDLQRRFGSRRDELLRRRAVRPRRDRPHRAAGLPAETADVRDGDWTVPPPPPGLVDRRVEITGPTERKMTINALNSGAKVWLADLEDANTPHWANVVGGQVNLYDAVRRTIAFDAPDGRHYELNGGPTPTIVMRPRGWHLRRAAPAGRRGAGRRRAGRLRALLLPQRRPSSLDRGSGPYFYLPKMESHHEARLWNDVFTTRRSALGIAAGHDPGHRADRDHPGRVRDGRDPVRAARPRRRPQRRPLGLPVQHHQVLPRRGPRSCCRTGRGDDDRAVHAGVHRAAGRDLPPARRVRDGRHGRLHPEPPRPGGQRGRAGQGPRRTRSARPATASTAPGWPTPTWCRSAGRSSTACSATARTSSTGSAPTCTSRADQLLDVAATAGRGHRGGPARQRLGRRLQYLAVWLRGNGAVAINNLMEDAATAEISRSQVWQWIHNGVRLDGGEPVTAELVRGIERGAARSARRRRRGWAGTLRRRPPAVRAGRAGRRLRRLPHPARVRADRLMRSATGASTRALDAPARRRRRGAGRALSGRARRPPAGAHRLRAGRPGPRRTCREACGAARARRRSAEHGRCPSPTTSRGRVARQARPRADRGPADRLRGRLRRAGDDAEEDARPGPRRRRCSPADRRPPFVGSAIKCLEAATRRRAMRTLDLSSTRWATLPDGFVITLPKVSAVGAGRRRWSRCADGWRRRTGWPPARCASRSRSRRRRRCSAPTAPRPWPG